jgi:hypothetical protein
MTARLLVSRSLAVRDRVAAAIVAALDDDAGRAALRALIRTGAWPVDEVASVVQRLEAGARVAAAYRDRVGDPTPTALRGALAKSALLFDAGLFFEVHEVLEAEWIALAEPERSAVQGLIQIAVALHHLAHANPRGATALFAAGRGRLAPHRPTFLGLDVAALLAGLEPWEEAAAAGVWPRAAALPPFRVGG